MTSADQLINNYLEAEKAIYKHTGYVEDWARIPLDIVSNHFWCVDENEREYVKHCPQRAGIEFWLRHSREDDRVKPCKGCEHCKKPDCDEWGPFGKSFYGGPIYTQRHLPRWVYRGTELTIICHDTQQDLNRVLLCVRSSLEVKLW